VPILNMNIWFVATLGTLTFLTITIALIIAIIMSKRRQLESKQRELEKLSRSERKYRSLFENSLAGIVRFSLETWEILDANDAMKQIFGCTADPDLARCFSGMPKRNILDIQHVLLTSDFIHEYEIRTNRFDGRELWILISAKMTGEEHIAHGVIVDITDRKVSAEKISEQAMLLDESQDAIMVTDYQGRITFWNSGAELIYGWKRKKAVGSFIRDLIFDEMHSKDYDLAMEDILQFNEWSGEQYHFNNEKKELLIQGRWKKVESAATNKKNILIVNTDITEKRRQEIQVLRAQRMESIALLTGGIAHDLQNVLAPVTMSVGLLRERLTDVPSIKVLDAVEESARSGIDLVRNIITYGHGIPGERVVVGLPDLLESVLTIVRQSLPETIHLEQHIQGGSYQVLGDTNQLKQVFLNIVVNARDALTESGLITLGISKAVVDEKCLDRFPEAQAGVYHKVTISDNGHGIPEDCIERIFEPFFTTKSNGNGTGLGLSIALGIIKSHAGFITVQSVENEGTQFEIYLPALES
jgi:two-component system, cell cycle sensor histidine kinase and response regulator CckA